MVSRGRVPLYAVIAGDVTVHDRGRVASASVVHGRRACGRGAVSVVAVAVVPWTWPRHGRDRVVFVSPSHGCDTPTDASVCNGLCGVCVVLVCYLTG